VKLPSRFTSRRQVTGVLTACAALLAACSDADRPSPVSPTAPSSHNLAVSAAPADAAHQLARAFAAAMRNAEVRAQVRNAMRSSPYNEHKLVLREFAATRAGRRLVEAAAKESGTTVGEIDALIAALPEMDFYAPFQAHRRTWRGGADVAVGTAMDVDGTAFTAYTAGGQELSYGAGSGAPRTAWLFMHPAEPKSFRRDPQANTPGTVIQDPSDGMISIQNELPVDHEVGGGGSVGGGSMVLQKFTSNVFDGIGAAELRFIVRDANNLEIAAHRFDGIDAVWALEHTVNYTFPRGTFLHLREIDTFDSDDKGTFRIVAIPGWVAAELVDCFPHYRFEGGYSFGDAELMCGPRSFDPVYAPPAGPHWSAYLR